MEASKTRVLEHGKGLAALPFAGIGDFNGKIVFAKVQEGPELDRLKDIAGQLFPGLFCDGMRRTGK